MKNKNTYGDEYVILQIRIPGKVSEKERELLKQLKEIESKKIF